MSENINGFLGTWQVEWLDGQDPDPVFPVGTQFKIGTDAEGSAKPFLNETNDVCVGFVVQEPDPNSPGAFNTILSSDGTARPLRFSDGVLRWEGRVTGDPDPRLLRVYIALAVTPDGRTRFLYGTTLRGDPDQVAVWGATDHTPP